MLIDDPRSYVHTDSRIFVLPIINQLSESVTKQKYGKKDQFSKTKSNSKSVPVLKTKCSAGTGTEKVIRYCNSVQK